MIIQKKKISDLTLCYWVTTLQHQGRRCLLAASEKAYPAQLFDENGNYIENVWDEPGGTMTAVALPGTESAFLATHRMYSPDDCRNASIVLCRYEDHLWTVRTLAELPGVHRFDILTRNGVNYLIACTIKSDYEHDDDWRFPGKVWACALPDALCTAPGEPIDLPEDYRLPLAPIREGLLKNHGYSRSDEDGVLVGIVTSEEGVFRFTPPAAPDGAWTVEQLLEEPTSDALFIDLDGDGVREMLTLSPFHGDTLKVFALCGGRYEQVWEYEKKLPFAHAICAAEGTPAASGAASDPANAAYETLPAHFAVIGHRQGDRDLLAVYHRDGRYAVEVLDHDVGPANAVSFRLEGKTRILAANRETNEVAYYTVS